MNELEGEGTRQEISGRTGDAGSFPAAEESVARPGDVDLIDRIPFGKSTDEGGAALAVKIFDAMIPAKGGEKIGEAGMMEGGVAHGFRRVIDPEKVDRSAFGMEKRMVGIEATFS